MARLVPPSDSDTWLGLCDGPLPVGEAAQWAIRPDCGGLVLFNGTARDHAAGRPEVSLLEYEAYEEQVAPRLTAIAAASREQWPDVGRIVLLHRIGPVGVGESAVVVVVSAPHRAEAFAAARYCIDTVKASVPIWKRERWRDGESWGLEAQHVEPVGRQGSGG